MSRKMKFSSRGIHYAHSWVDIAGGMFPDPPTTEATSQLSPSSFNAFNCSPHLDFNYAAFIPFVFHYHLPNRIVATCTTYNRRCEVPR